MSEDYYGEEVVESYDNFEEEDFQQDAEENFEYTDVNDQAQAEEFTTNGENISDNDDSNSRISENYLNEENGDEYMNDLPTDQQPQDATPDGGNGGHNHYKRHYHRYRRHHKGSALKEVGDLGDDEAIIDGQPEGSHPRSWRYRYSRRAKSSNSHKPVIPRISAPTYDNMRQSLANVSFGSRSAVEQSNRSVGFGFRDMQMPMLGEATNSATRNLANGGKALSRTLSKAISNAKPKMSKMSRSAPTSPIEGCNELRPIESPIESIDEQIAAARKRLMLTNEQNLQQKNTPPAPPQKDVPEMPLQQLSCGSAPSPTILNQTPAPDGLQDQPPPPVPKDDTSIPETAEKQVLEYQAPVENGLTRQFTPPYPVFNQLFSAGVLIPADEKLGTSIAITAVAMPDPAAYGVKV